MSAYDALYNKDIQSFRVEKGSSRELRYKIPYGGRVVVRISASEPVIVTMSGPHIDKSTISDIKEYKFESTPGDELVIKFQGMSGFFAKPSNVTLEVEMYTSREVINIAKELNNLLGILKDLGKDYYTLNKVYIQEVLKEIANVWNLLDDETKNNAKELMRLAKGFEGGGS